MIWASSHSLTPPQVIQLPKKLLIFILRVALGITLEITKPRLSTFSIYTFSHYFTHFFSKSVRFIRLCRATHWFIAVFRFISLPLWLLALFSVVERLRQRVRALLASYVPYQPLQPSHRANPAYFDNVWSPGWCWSIGTKFFLSKTYCLNHWNVNFCTFKFLTHFSRNNFFSFRKLEKLRMKPFSFIITLQCGIQLGSILD